MKTVLCIISGIFAVLHLYAAMAHIKTSKNKTNDILMIGGALAVLGGIVFCLMERGFDWITAFMGFGLIIIAAVQNGRQKQNFHIRHHILRIAISVILVIGFIIF